MNGPPYGMSAVLDRHRVDGFGSVEIIDEGAAFTPATPVWETLRRSRIIRAADIGPITAIGYMRTGLPPDESTEAPSTPARTMPTTEPTREGTDEDISNLGCS